MPGGGHRFGFVGKEPPVFPAGIGLLFVNTFALLVLDFGAKYVLPKASPQFAALGLLIVGLLIMAAIVTIFMLNGFPHAF